MIEMSVAFDQEILNVLKDLPYTIQYKCIDPAARKMAQPVIALATQIAPDSSKSTDGTRPPSQTKWSQSARRKYDTGPSRLHIIRKWYKTTFGGILYVGMKSDGKGLGKKMHFRVPIRKKRRRQFFWGRPAETVGEPGTYSEFVPLEEKFFLRRALDQQYNHAFSIFKDEFFKQVRKLNNGS